MNEATAPRGNRLRRTAVLAALAAPAALAAVPAVAAAAPVIAADAICVRPVQSPTGGLTAPPLQVSGSGFGAGASVTLRRGSRSISGIANADGTISATLSVLDLLTGTTPRSTPFTLVAEDAGGPGGNPPAQGSSNVVKLRAAPLGFAVSPARAKPSDKVTFKLSGLTPARPVWAHYRFNGKVRANVRIGLASNPCGLLTVKRRQIPVSSPQIGLWRVQFDQSRKFSARTTPRIPATINVYRTIVR